MKFRSTKALRPVWVTLAIVGCAKSPHKLKLDLPHKENELILTLRPGESFQTESFLRSHSSATVEILNERSTLLRFSEENPDLQRIAQDLAYDRSVHAVEANLIYRLDESRPNDADFNRLYGLHNDGSAGGVAGADIGMLKAWDHGTGSAEVMIGIIDSGTDYNHPDLAGNIWKNPGETGLDANGQDRSGNGIDDDGNGYIDDWQGWDFFNNDNNPMDDHSHGTHVAGTIGGMGNNGQGVAGVNWSVSMVPIKVFSAAGESSSDILIRGIDYATQLGVVATNNSWGGGDHSEAMLAAIERADARGILFVAAAGNNGGNNDMTPHYPSSYNLPNIIAVAATDRRDKLALFSNYGAESVHVAAPGADIWSTTPNGSYGSKSGTSMATPHVTGLVALLKSSYPALNARDLKGRILNATGDVPQLQSLVKFGRISAANALENDTLAPSPVQELRLVETGAKDLRLSWKESGDDGEIGRAGRYLVRVAADPILDERDWDAAAAGIFSSLVRQDGVVKAGITGLSYNQSAYIAVRAMDNVGNLSALSQGVAFTTKPVTVLLMENADSDANWLKLEGSWTLADSNGLSVLSDSANGSYENNSNIVAETVDFSFQDSDLMLDLKTRYDLETGYDFGLLELSRDQGVTWVELQKMTGNSDWTSISISLREVLQGSGRFRLRFRLQTDFTINRDGWEIDSFQIVGAQL